MKLFLYDAKHENVFGELELGKLNDREMGLIEDIICWLERKKVLDRYKTVALAENYKVQELTEDGEATGFSEIVFN